MEISRTVVFVKVNAKVVLFQVIDQVYDSFGTNASSCKNFVI